MGTKVSNLSKYAVVEKTQVAGDGTTKFLLRLLDGEHIECVLLRQDYGDTVCISSQVGCKMKCAFCASGSGYVRDLTAVEMLAQVLVARKGGGIAFKSIAPALRFASGDTCADAQLLKSTPPPPRAPNVTHVVIMGSGEPFDNYDNVVEFLDMVDIGARKISVSTCGIPDKIRAFADRGGQQNLCISLHAPNDFIRQQIMPIAKRFSIDEVLASAKYFFEKTHRRVIFEYALIDGVNCSVENAVELAQRLKRLRISYHVNLINLNASGGALKPPSKANAMIFMDTLIKSGVSCTMRKGKGQEIQGACGQLRARGLEESSANVRQVATPLHILAPSAPQDLPKSLPAPLLYISLDPAVKAGNLKEYVAEVNGWKGVGIHLDVMRKELTNCEEDRFSDEEIKWVYKNARVPIDLHMVGRGVRQELKSDANALVVMTVIPGESGRPFIRENLEEVKRIRKEKPSTRIIVDGGINYENAAIAKSAGADCVVVGSFVYNAGLNGNSGGREERARTVARLLDILRK